MLAEPLNEREREILALIAEGHTNREIADRLYLAEKTIRWYNTQIYSKLDVSNRHDAVEQAQALGLLETETTETPPTQTRHNLPFQTTPFIGRQQELADIAQLLADPDLRLLTILAPGGMGKTRLALAAAEGQLAHFQDGVFFVPLAPLKSTHDIVTTIAESVGFSFYGNSPPQQQLLDYFRDRNLLLVLDNFEHLLEGAPLVTDVIQASPDLKALATSREKLNLSGETVFTLSGLYFPTWETPNDALEYDAVKLFMQSVHRARPDFELHSGNLDDLARICRLTAGMPLAIVLAAGWIDVLSLEQIAAELQQGIDILETELRDVPERHRSIRATFNYSWSRLSDSERDVFMKLSVFRGGFTAESAKEVAGTNLRILRKLVDRALVQSLPGDRHDIHELLRQYAEEKLNATGEVDTCHAAHMAFFAEFMQQRIPEIKGRSQLEALDEIEADWNNVRAAWAWALSHQDWGAIGQMMEALHLFCDLRARYSDGEALFIHAVDALEPGDGAPHPLWGELLVRAAEVLQLPESFPRDSRVAELLDRAAQDAQMSADPLFLWVSGRAVEFQLGDPSKLALLETSLARFRDRKDDYYCARVLRILTWVYDRLGVKYVDQFTHYHQQYLELTRSIGDEIGTAHALFYAGDNALQQMRLAEGEEFLYEARAIWRKMRDQKSIGVVNNWLGDLAFFQGDFEKAKPLLTEALRLASEVNYPGTRNGSLGMLGVIDCLEGNYEAGQQMFSQLQNIQHLFSLLPIIACGLGDFHTARRHIQSAFQKIGQWPVNQWRIEVFVRLSPMIAMVLAHEDQRERAVELLGLGFSQTFFPVGWMENWPLLTEFRHNLETELGAETYAAAWARGAQLDIEAVYNAMLTEFAGQE